MKKYNYLFLGLLLIFLSIYYKNILFGIGGVLAIFLKSGNIPFKLFDNKH